ncbi:MAG: bifunctional proline dehydrogenase/L-glutamate gamma-semialdehyde dehydrogenase [Deltaproteobacteria bacterium]|nr:bifunctional proline dehydrogenase/L-glutamate gamma-semialdehyde dehydrogenase [Deltaproteobacteria bacterium]
MKTPIADPIVDEAASLAEAWQKRANTLLTAEEKGIAQQMERLVTHPKDKVALTRLIDQSFRSENTSRIADQINSLLREYGVPDFFSSVEKLLVQMFMGFGRYIPSISVPKMIEKMRHDSSRAIIPGEPDVLKAHLRMRKAQGVRMNINYLGEAILGEEEALKRLDTTIAALKNPEIEYISVKISSIYSQIQPLAFDHTVGVLKERLSRLYRTAGDHVFIRADGTRVPKFVNLDMEEYRDLEITVAAFIETLNQQGLKNHSAGIALQAYLPDSFDMQKEITAWARARVEEGGGPIKIRIVKGANMEMEKLETAIQNWPLAPYDNKLDVDANFKRMVEFGMKPENIPAVHMGIASHNLFELAYAYLLARQNSVTDYFSFEMLKGMADHVRRAVQEMSGDVVVYAPVAARDQFITAIAYLIRRLDENTAEENFLRHSFDLKPGLETWAFLKTQFEASYNHMEKAGRISHRTQNRMNETFSEKIGTFHEKAFDNTPDTDWSLVANRAWAETVRNKWRKSPADSPVSIPLVIGGEETCAGRTIRKCMDHSQLPEEICIAAYTEASDADVDRAVAVAKADPDGWRDKRMAERHEILSRAALEIRRGRGDLMGAAAAETGKIFTEADPEVSEAVDFTEFYPFSVDMFTDIKNVKIRGRGVGLVISPWNFPIAIPCSGIVASLAAGNTVIFKPASAAVITAWQLCQCFWKAGVSKKVLQFLPCAGQDTGAKFARHPDVDFVILTGGTDTGMTLLKQRPGVFLAAETGGKNATIVTAMSDRGQAIKHVLHSAFGNCGQKCSATSLLILEKEVYDDETFKRQLVDAAGSFRVGSAWDFENKMGPLIHPPGKNLERALTRLEPGESWALKPEKFFHNPFLWTPGIKWGVRPQSFTHFTEFFGPLLGVMCADDLDHAIEMVNQTGYGLTSGLESLDHREQDRWKARVNSGNLYINRGTTGAIVLRQPFGGLGKSSIGAGIKAGGPNYVSQFMDFEDMDFPSAGAIQNDHPLLRLAQAWQQKLNWGWMTEFKADLTKIIRAVKSYLYWWEQEFSREKDYFHLRGQDNILRYLPVGPVLVRVHPDDSLFDVLGRIAAVRISGCKLVVSVPPGMNGRTIEFLWGRHGQAFLGGIRLQEKSDKDLIEIIPEIRRIRYVAADRVPDEVFQVAAETGFYISRTPVLMEGRIELLQYFQEQSICSNYHRYGNLGERGLNNGSS